MSKPIDYGQHELGWVSLQDIKNVWVEQLREFDVTIWPPNTAGSRPYVQKFFDNVQRKLYQRAAAHYESFLLDNPGARPQQRKKDETPAPDGRESHQKRLETMQRRNI